MPKIFPADLLQGREKGTSLGKGKRDITDIDGFVPIA